MESKFSRVHWDVEIKDGEYVKTENPEFNWVWSPQGIIYMHMPEFWGIVQFAEQAPGREKIQFKKSEIDRVKMALRKLYVRQRNYYFRKDRYTSSLKALNLNTNACRRCSMATHSCCDPLWLGGKTKLE